MDTMDTKELKIRALVSLVSFVVIQRLDTGLKTTY
jgi:hypothetical protein